MVMAGGGWEEAGVSRWEEAGVTMGLTALVSRLFLATLILLYIALSLLVWIATGQVKCTALAAPPPSLARSLVWVATGQVQWTGHLSSPLELHVAFSSPPLPTPHSSPLHFQHCLFQQLMCPRSLNLSQCVIRP